MISKIKNIKNLAVFKKFEWDNICEFKDINILYGRNYSGKTTLSRIFRAMETGNISDKYENPEFCVSIQDKGDVTQNNLKNHSEEIRVFNEDFVKDNLRFISDSDASIEPFAILGADNNIVEDEIKILRAELGSSEEKKETGLYAELKSIDSELQTASESYNTAQAKLDTQLGEKATAKTGIKYKSERFGDQNYSIQKLRNDIQEVLKDDFEAITDEKKTESGNLLAERTLENIPNPQEANLQFDSFLETTKQLVEKEIGVANKIAELVNNAELSKWVKEGLPLHKDKRTTCAFCNNKIQEDRWSELDKHFDEESEKLEKEIDNLIAEIKNEKNKIEQGLEIDNNKFYSKFHSNLNSLSEKYDEESGKYNKSLDELNSQLEARKNKLISPQEFKQPDNENNLMGVWNEFEKIYNKSNEFTNSLKGEQTKAQKSLRLREVSDFITTIKYSDQVKKIDDLKKEDEKKTSEKTRLDKKIEAKINSIENKKKLLKDESKGADKVNEYLNDFFGHQFISLQSIEFQDEGDGTKKVKFEIIRDKKKAYHLSEGENNLIAFCYFMAKLEDIETKDTKPIIWIDDPVSSLDGNHIFFVYSLIKAKIVDEGNFEQLFISTHSLEFLKYLKRLQGKFLNQTDRQQDYSKEFFIVNRSDIVSSIKPMPEYLKKYITEFNYLFQQIYDCSLIGTFDDNNYPTCYNFGNTARKFLEIFLYYKYPDSSDQKEKIKKFFDEETAISAILTSRIGHEYSHLSGGFERGAVPIEVPEMQAVAEKILEKMKETDKEQYDALLKSIGKFEGERES